MKEMTASIIVHSIEGGGLPPHILLLSETMRPRWILHPFDVYQQGYTGNRVVWMPTTENMLEDGLLLVTLHLLKDEKVVQMAKEYFKKDPAADIQMYDDIDPEGLNEMRVFGRHCKKRCSLLVSVLAGSYLMERPQLSVLKKYPNLDPIVCLQQENY